MIPERNYYADSKLLPTWFQYPDEFRVLVDQGLVEFAPWRLADAKFALKTYEMVKKRYNRELLPIGYRHGSDTVACIEKGDPKKIKIINGYTSPGHENEGVYSSFWDWFRFVINELIELNG